MTADERLAEAVAKCWLDGGGDTEGFLWCWRLVADTICRMEQKRTSARQKE